MIANSVSQSAAAYRRMAVNTASAGQLVLMLFDGALNRLSAADAGFDIDDMSRRNETINENLVKAQSIIAELQGTLDKGRGGEFAATMERLYDFMLQRLLAANLSKERSAVVEVRDLLRELRDAWRQMLQGQAESRQPGQE